MNFVVVWILEGMTASLHASFETKDEANSFVWQKLLEDDQEKIECIDVLEKGKPVFLTIGQ
jgi:hypothetical protein